MTALPPATPDDATPTPAPPPDRIDTIARVRAIGLYHRPAAISVERDTLTCQCGHESANTDGLEEHRATLIVDLFLTEPAVVRALADHLMENHPDVTDWRTTPGVAVGGIYIRLPDGRASYIPAVALIGEDGEIDITPTGESRPVTIVDDTQDQP
ncbi:hypothetical protein [Phycicoccus avicenniae]|uniref:hypothetical protein n=1 Tax=Phycicoccus avicenniae TaxID=2828860 RepID=UPI003D26B952